MRIILTAIDEPLAQAWQAFCGDLDAVSIHHGSILDLDCDAIVSPANSFGFMDGGIDDLYLTRFGRDLHSVSSLTAITANCWWAPPRSWRLATSVFPT